MNEKFEKKFTKDEIKKATLEYFNGDELATDVWMKKYCLKDNDDFFELTPDDMHKRIAKELSRIEKKYPNPINENDIYDSLKNFKRIVPQGSPMSGIGNDFQILSLSNCFVIGNEKDSDSYGGILKLDQEIVQLQKRRGGVGLDLSFIRPVGSPVKNSAITSTGVVPFMERFSNTTKEVAQDGRRGALMESISIKHPDSEDFIDAKLNLNKVTGSNISVKIDDDFMESMINNSYYIQSFPISIKTKNITELDIENIEYDKIYKISEGYIKKINPQKLWNKIIHNAWKSAEPGILFWDKIIDESIPDCYVSDGFKTISTNPCVSDDTLILTDKGYFEISELINKNVNVWNGEEFSEVIPMITGLNHKMLKIEFSDGSELKCTPYHGFYVYDEKNLVVKKEAKNLKIGDKLEIYDFPIINNLKTRNNKIETKQLRLYKLNSLIENTGFFDDTNNSIKIKSKEKNFLLDIKYLLNTLGANGMLNKLEDKYVLTINQKNMVLLCNIGLKTKFNKIFNNLNNNENPNDFISITSIENIENEEKVYCFNESKRGRGCFNGIVTANCGEIPLCANDSCRLLSLNLFGYVVNPFTKNSYFNWDLFESDIIKAQRYMDDIIDLEIEKIDKILEKIKSDPEDDFIKIYETNLWENIKKKTILGRRTGLGVTAEGDMLAALNLIYGTNEATNFSEKIHKFIKLNAYKSSIILAKERGAFPIYNHEKEKDNPFLKRIMEEDSVLYSDMLKYGRRNIALLTIAPTGSVSIMTQTTSGIEPVFNTVYMRRRKINPQEKNSKIDFVDDEGVAWVEYPVFHHNFELWLKTNGYDVELIKSMTITEINEIIKKSPYYKATSNDVDWLEKVKMQGAIQKHVDHSISVTVNLPEHISEDIVSKVYETGWKSGCKGITVYRDGSRSGVLVNIDNKNTFKENHAPKRPKRLKGEIHRFQNNLEKWIAVVGLKNDRPYEIFTGKLQNGLSYLPNNIKECEVVKNIFEIEEDGKLVKKKRYDIEYFDNDGNKLVHTELNHAFNPEFWNYAKFISGVLRHGMPIVYVYELIDSLNFKEDHINTWKNGVGRVIKKYIKDGEKGKGCCPNCGSCDGLHYVEGCLVCKSCGNSKCG